MELELENLIESEPTPADPMLIDKPFPAADGIWGPSNSRV